MAVNELKCEERKLSKQLDVIKKGLNDLGCEELPSGCDLPLDNSFDHTNDSQVMFMFNNFCL